MPLYMDFQVNSGITMEKVKKARIADRAMQERYQVKYHQFWVNEATGTIFCLMEGPNKEACETVHRETYGNMVCEIVEVVPGMYNIFTGEHPQADHRMFLHEDGSVDDDYCFILVINFSDNTHISRSADRETLKLTHPLKTLALQIIHKFQGKEIKHSGDDILIAVFVAANDAVRCAVEIHAELGEKSKYLREDTLLKIGINGGQRATGKYRFFEKTIQLAQRLSAIAENQQIVTTALVEKIGPLSEIAGQLPPIRVVSAEEEKFLVRLFDMAEDQLTDKTFSVERLGRDMGISRPQLYRKIMALTGHSPNDFIRNLRMQKAFSLIRKKQYNISEVALEVGINNPSYFAKRFQEKYGIIPSKVMC